MIANSVKFGILKGLLDKILDASRERFKMENDVLEYKISESILNESIQEDQVSVKYNLKVSVRINGKVWMNIFNQQTDKTHESGVEQLWETMLAGLGSIGVNEMVRRIEKLNPQTQE